MLLTYKCVFDLQFIVVKYVFDIRTNAVFDLFDRDMNVWTYKCAYDLQMCFGPICFGHTNGK